MSNEERAQELISIFNCENDKDIESFIKERAILFEKLGKSRTYLIFDEDEYLIKVTIAGVKETVKVKLAFKNAETAIKKVNESTTQTKLWTALQNPLFDGVAKAANSVGSLVGCSYGDVHNCYSTGSVSGNDNVGGLIGG